MKLFGISERRFASMSKLKIKPTATIRAVVFLLGDLVIWTASLWGAFLIRFDGTIPKSYVSAIPVLLAVLVPIKLAWYFVFRSYQLTWRLVGMRDFIKIAKANTLALLTVTAVVLLFRKADGFATLPRSVLLLDYLLATCGVTLFRAARRGWQMQWETYRGRDRARNGTKLLIFGAGAAGARIVQTILESSDRVYQPVGFVDDDSAKRGAYVHGFKVLGGRRELAEIVHDHSVDEILIAVPSVPPARLREIIEDIRKTGMQRVKIMPGMHEILAGHVTLKDVRDVDLHDLLPRPPVKIQYDALKTYLARKRVLVTGAAGSIGSELVRQLCRFEVEQLVAADVSESGLFELEQELNRHLPSLPLRTMILDVRDTPKVEWVVGALRPHLVFHAAAYKHVPLMERDVDEAVKTNVFGTLAIAEAALRHGVEMFVFISTDKAVNPISVMGASKRAGELIVQALGGRNRTRFLAVRFGNVLGSRGSLIPVLQEQIRRGGPVTITHPDMARYFMSVAEAVLLVLQIPLMATRGQIFMLDMGEPVRIVDLVHELIRLSGLEADRDIPIVYSGIRQGEKIEEELVMLQEHLVDTPFERIMEVRSADQVDEVKLRLILRELEQLVRGMDNEGVRALLQHLVGSLSQASPPVDQRRTGAHASG